MAITKNCEICGKEITVQNIRRRYCAECATVKQKEAAERWRQAHKEEIRRKARERYVKREYIYTCEMCGKRKRVSGGNGRPRSICNKCLAHFSEMYDMRMGGRGKEFEVD